MRKAISFALLLAVIICVFLGGCEQTGLFGETDDSNQSANSTSDSKSKLWEAYSKTLFDLDGVRARLSDDRMTLTVTIEPDGLYYSAASAIKKTNTNLGFSSSLWAKMESTRAIDGMQTQKSADFTVSWTYHPDNGLKIIYEINQ